MPPSPAAFALPLALVGLLLTALPASAEVRFSGEARMGLLRSADLDEDSPRWSFTSRLRLTLEAEGETDGGLTFGGRFRLDHAGPHSGAPRRPGHD